MRLAACLVGVAMLGGCAAHRAPAAAGTTMPIEDFAEKVRQLAAERPSRPNDVLTLEQRDPELAAARLLVTVAPTADHHRRLADAYARNGVLDAAYDQFLAATEIDPHDAASFDGLARIWRDWGFPHLGLSDAYRAVYFAPASPVPQNTLGTVLLKMGRIAAAREAFARALALDPNAAYALNNLCYADRLEGRGTQSIAQCRGLYDTDR